MLKEQGRETLRQSLKASWKWRLLSLVLGGGHLADMMRREYRASGNQNNLVHLTLKKQQTVQDVGEKAKCKRSHHKLACIKLY